MTRKSYPTDVSDEEWAFVAPYLTLMSEDAPQREHNLREVFNGLRYVVRAGGAWRMMPHDLPPWAAFDQQMQRWLKAGVFEAIVHEERELLRILNGRNEQPSAVILDSRTMQSTVESGGRAGYDGGKRKKGSKIHIAVDTLGHLERLGGHSGECTGSRAGGRTGTKSTTNHWRICGSGFCRPRIHWVTTSN